MEKDDSYQQVLDLGGAHPSRQKYGDEFFKFIDELEKHGFSSLTVGHATEHDECKLRHVTGVINKQEIWYDCSDWPDEFRIHDWDFWSIIGNEVDIEALVTIRVGAKDILSGNSLYITEPELKDDSGCEITWNYYD